MTCIHEGGDLPSKHIVDRQPHVHGSWQSIDDVGRGIAEGSPPMRGKRIRIILLQFEFYWNDIRAVIRHADRAGNIDEEHDVAINLAHARQPFLHDAAITVGRDAKVIVIHDGEQIFFSPAQYLRACHARNPTRRREYGVRDHRNFIAVIILNIDRSLNASLCGCGARLRLIERQPFKIPLHEIHASAPQSAPRKVRNLTPKPVIFDS